MRCSLGQFPPLRMYHSPHSKNPPRSEAATALASFWGCQYWPQCYFFRGVRIGLSVTCSLPQLLPFGLGVSLWLCGWELPWIQTGCLRVWVPHTVTPTCWSVWWGCLAPLGPRYLVLLLSLLLTTSCCGQCRCPF